MVGVTKEEAKEIFSPYFGKIYEAWDLAWKDWINSPFAANLQHKRVRANCVWNQFNAHLKQLLDEIPGVTASTTGNVIGLVFDYRLFLRIKKSKRNLLSSNLKTQATLDFHNSQLSLFGEEARLELVYVLNKAETSLERLALVNRHMQEILWSLDIEREQDISNLIDFIPEDPNKNSSYSSAAKSIVKSKIAQDRSKESEPKSGS